MQCCDWRSSSRHKAVTPTRRSCTARTSRRTANKLVCFCRKVRSYVCFEHGCSYSGPKAYSSDMAGSTRAPSKPLGGCSRAGLWYQSGAPRCAAADDGAAYCSTAIFNAVGGGDGGCTHVHVTPHPVNKKSSCGCVCAIAKAMNLNNDSNGSSDVMEAPCRRGTCTNAVQGHGGAKHGARIMPHDHGDGG